MSVQRRLSVLAALAALAVVLLAAGCGGGDSDVDAYCDKLAELQSEPDPFSGLQEGDLEGVKTALDDYQGKIEEVVEVAPEEIQGDVEDLQSVFADFNEDIQGVSTPQDALGIVSQIQAQGQEIQQITQRLTAYTEENCGDA